MKKSYQISLTSILFICSLFNLTNTAMAASTPSLGMASSYAILSDTYTNPSGPTTINGDIGFTTAPLIAPLGIHINYGSFAPYSTAGTDQASALIALNSRSPTFSFAPGAIDLATDITRTGTLGVYTPGVYDINGAADIGGGGTITLSGAGTYIFRINGALNTSANSLVVLTNGANACDVFWRPNGSTTLNANSTFVGTIIPVSQDITLLDTISWIGRALTFGHTVTTSNTNTTITVPTGCIPSSITTGNLHIIKQVINTNGGTAISSSFNLSVKTSTGAHVIGSPAIGTDIGSGNLYTLTAGTYIVSEDANNLYTASFHGDCDINGNITLSAGQDKTCIVTNTDIALIPHYSGGGGGAGGVIDNCPSGDYSTGYYDNECGTAPITGNIIKDVIVIQTHTGTTIAPLIDTIEPTPHFPKTGMISEQQSRSWNIIILISILMIGSLGSILMLRRKKAM